MGCDIHLYREKHVGGQWVSADAWETKEYGEDSYTDVPWEQRFTDRNYNLFSILACVRGREPAPYQFAPRGRPVVMSPQVAAQCGEEDGGYHSHSYLYLHEIKELRAFLAAEMQPISGMMDRDQLAELEAGIAAGTPDWNGLYPYCQGTNDPKQVSFSVDVPADFIVGGALDRIIASLSDIGGDNQRIVFWFDN